MRIVHIIDYFQPSLGYQETYLAQVQIQDGHEVFVVTSERYAPSLYPAVESLIGKRIKKPGIFVEEGVPVIRLPILFEILGRVWSIGLRKIIMALSPDVIFIHGILSVATIQVAGIRKNLSARIIVDDHMVYSASRRPLRFLYSLFRIIFRSWLSNKLDKIVSTQKGSTRFIIEQFGFSTESISFIPHGCDTSLFTKNEESGRKIRKRFNIPGDKIVFVYAGKLIPEKGLHILVQAALTLIRRKENIHVLIVGNGDEGYIRKIHDLIMKHDASDSFTFVGMVRNDKLFEYYSASDVGVWPLQCSLTMIEAMSCELPIIISDESGTPDRVETGSGLLYQNGSWNDLTKKMACLLNDPKRESMSQKAREFAESHDWKRVSEKFLKE